MMGTAVATSDCWSNVVETEASTGFHMLDVSVIEQSWLGLEPLTNHLIQDLKIVVNHFLEFADPLSCFSLNQILVRDLRVGVGVRALINKPSFSIATRVFRIYITILALYKPCVVTR